MESQKFIQNFIDQFDETDEADISLETKFRDLEEWSSLIALSVIAMVDEEYAVKLSGDDIRQSQTVGDLFGIVKAKA